MFFEHAFKQKLMNFKIHCTSGKSIKSDLIHLSKVRKAMVEHLQANTTSSPL